MLNILKPGMFNAILVAMGANLPGHMDSPVAQLEYAVRALGDSGLEIIAQSRYFRTPCIPAGAGPDFVNAVLACRSDLTPRQVLDLLHRVEADAGRTRDARWQPRALDLDLLAYGQQILPDRDEYARWAALSLEQQMQTAPPELILPHPRLHQRGFVLVPLMDVAPDWVHPVLGQSVRAMHDALDPAELRDITPL